MSRRLNRRIVIACALGASVVAGLPDSTALERAVSKVFVAGDTPRRPTSVFNASRVWRTAQSNPMPAPKDVHEAEAARPREFGRVLTPLYASFVGLQVLDAHSTLLAIRRGARETNPVMNPFVDRPAGFVALKAGTAAGIMYMTERVRRHSPLAAVVMMAAFNSAYATVVARNYRVASQLAR